MNESSWTLVAQVPLSQNLSSLVQELQQRGIGHRVVVDEHRQSVWVEDPENILLVDELLKNSAPRRTGDPWFDGAPSSRRRGKPVNHTGSLVNGVAGLFRQYPVVMASIFLSVLGAFIVSYAPQLQLQLIFQGYYSSGAGYQFETVNLALSRAEYWRLITPIFLHFSIMHLVFNSLWLWVFGTRIEALIGSIRFAAVVLLSGLAGNVLQYLVSGPSLFGGMSGVVYGLLGYLWIRHYFAPQPATALPPGLVGFMLFFLFLGMTGVMDSVVGGGIANGAHVGGLVAGMALGWFAAQASRSRR